MAEIEPYDSEERPGADVRVRLPEFFMSADKLPAAAEALKQWATVLADLTKGQPFEVLANHPTG